MQKPLPLKCMICFPHSKINLGLKIIGKRNDGYHDIESILFPIPLFDVLEYRKSTKFSLEIFGLPVPGKIADNLLWKAFNLMHDHFEIPPLEIKLLKNIPMGAGLGGGSSDAAFFVKSLDGFLNLGLNHDQLKKLVLELGSDCPFFIDEMPALVHGRGEILNPINLPISDVNIVVVFSDIPISTVLAYSMVKPNTSKKSIEEIISQPMESWRNELVNDFELPIFELYPELVKIKDLLFRSGAYYSSMTGSGSAIYGLFDSSPKIHADLKKYRIWKSGQ